MESGSFAARNCFGPDSSGSGRVGRIATPTPLGVGDINSYLLFPPRGSDGITLIDCGVKTPESFAALQNGLKEFGVGFDEIERILITHAHMDHFGQAKRIRDLSGAAVFASSGEAELMRSHFSPSGDRRDIVMQYFARWGVPLALISGESRMAEFARQIQDPIEVDGTLEDGDGIAVHDLQLRVVATPGHCDAHIVFHEAERRWLFSGDHLLTDISPVPLLVFPKDPGAPRPKSLVRFFDSLARVERLDCELVFPSHGDVIRDHRRLIAGYRLHHEKRKLQMLRKLHGAPLSAWQLAAALFPKVHETQVFLVMSEVIGHLDLLLDEGSAVLEERDGVEYARAVS